MASKSTISAVLESLARLEGKVDSLSETIATIANDHRELRDAHDKTSHAVTTLTERVNQQGDVIRSWRGWVAKVAAGVGIALFLATVAMVFKK
jgi:hypothetical protein